MMHSNTLIPITAEGYEKLQKEMAYIKQVEAPKITQRISSARLLGDLSENAEYHSAKERQGHLLSRFKYLENIFMRASVITIPEKSDTVVFGMFVKVLNLNNDQVSQYRIVGDYESDVKQNMLSNKTPVARVLLGKRVGDIALVELVNNDIEFKILDISSKKME